MPDLYGWIVERIATVENVVRAAEKEHGRAWGTRWEASCGYFEITDGRGLLVADQVQPGAAGLIALHDPGAVLRRCAADRKLLEVHKPRGWAAHPYECEGCGYDGSHVPDPVTRHTNDCPVLLAAAEGYGLTEEILAGLDRPQLTPRQRRSVTPDLVAGVWGNALIESLETGETARRQRGGESGESTERA